MKVLFINAVNIKNESEMSIQPLSFGYLASSLRKEIGNFFAFRVISSNVDEEIRKFKPDIIGISSVSQNYKIAQEYAKFSKKYKIPVLIGGTHISMAPKTLTKDMDVGIIGEGEKTIVDIFKVFIKTGKLEAKELKKIKGIIFWDKGKIIQTPKRELIKDLDEILFPDRDILEIKKDASIFTSRGCPYKCAFCSSSRFWPGTRFFSAEYVAREIKMIYSKYKIKRIFIFDDLFVVDRERIKKLITLLEKENILKKIYFTCQIRANLVDDELVKLIKKLGVRSIWMGLESGNERILKFLKGENAKIKDNYRAVRLLKKAGIETCASFIIGSPDEKREEILDTLKFIRESQLDDFIVYLLVPLPGTPVWEYALKRKLVSENMDWDRLGLDFSKNYNKSIIVSEKISREELFKLYNLFEKEKARRYKKYRLKHGLRIIFEDPEKIIYFLRKLF